MIENFENLAPMISCPLMEGFNIGVDVVDVTRFQQLSYKNNKKFYTRVFTPNEIKYCLSFSNPELHFATNFAGKEAVYKAVNIFQDISLNKIEILRNKKGIPLVNLDWDFKQNLELIIKVSLSQTFSYAIAFAIAYKPSKVANKE